jgi:hypothetical protein
LGTIYGANHVFELSQYAKTFSSGTNPSGRLVLNPTANTTLSRYSQSFDWSYDGKYLAIGITSGPINDIEIYEFTGTSLVFRAGSNILGNATAYSVRWHPTLYQFVLGTAKNNFYSYLFTAPSTLTVGDTVAFTTPYAVAFQKRGTHVAVGGTNSTIKVYSYSSSGAGSFSLVATSTNALGGTIQRDALVWAPRGNKNDIIAVTNNGGTTGNVHLYNFTGAALNHLKAYAQGKAANTIDWCATSTYVAVGFADGTIRTYQHTAAANTIAQKQSYTTTSAINSINWKYNATELAVARAVAASYETEIYTFNTASYALTRSFEIALITDAICIRYFYNSTTKNSYVARSDYMTKALTVYKENYSPLVFKDVNLVLNGDLTLSSPLTFTGNCSISGRNSKITFTGDASLNIAPDSNLEVLLTTLDLKVPGAFSLQGGSSNLKFRNSTIQMYNDIFIADGKFDIYDDLTITGPHTFGYQSAYTTTIHSNAMLNFENGAEFKIGKTRATSIEPIYFEDASSQLNFNNATLHTTNSGFSIKRGTVNIYGTSNFDIDWTDTTISATMQGLVWGDGVNASNDPRFVLSGNGTRLNIFNGALVVNPVVTTSIIQFFGQPQIALNDTTIFDFKRSINLTNAFILSSTNAGLLFDPNANLILENVHFAGVDQSTDFRVTGTMIHPAMYNLDKDDFFNVPTASNFYRIINIIQDGNRIEGGGEYTGPFYYSSKLSGLTWNSPSKLHSNLDLKGGRIVFTENSGMASNFSFKRSGTAELNISLFELGPVSTTWDSNIYWVGNNTTFLLNSDVLLSGIWTFSGSMEVDGNGFLIDFAPSGTLILERGAQVSFKNISLHNISRRNRIICNDNNCKITLNYSKLVMCDDYLFDAGSIEVLHDSNIGIRDGLDGVYTFSYASTLTSTVKADAFLEIDKGARISIGRHDSTITNPKCQPLYFVDPSTSRLILNGGTLHITSSGMIMTHGTMKALDISKIETENTVYPYGLIFGDGTFVNDFELKIDGGSQLEITFGRIFYNNYLPNRVVFGGPTSSIEILNNDSLYAKTNLTLKDGSIYTSGSATYAVSQDAGVQVRQDNILKQSTFPAYSAQRQKVHGVNPYLMQNGDYYYINEGYATNNVIAYSGTSNFGGGGRFDGTLTLNNSSVTLRSELNSALLCNVALNGGTFVLDSDLVFASDKTFTGTGNVQIFGTSMIFGPATESNLTHTIYWQGLSNGNITLNAQRTSLSGTWTVGGNIVLNGKGNTLDLADRGVITIRPNSTLSLENVVLKGLGQNCGSINFMDDTATLRLSSAYLELDNDLSTTIGGIVVNGPTTIGLKNYNWTLDQGASMTVDGLTLWIDPLDKINHGNIKFGSGSIDKYLSLVSSGTIKMVLESDTTLQTQVRDNSNAIVYWSPITRGTSNATQFLSEHFVSVNGGGMEAIGAINGSLQTTYRGFLSSPIDLSGGTLTLSSDLILSNKSTIESSGKFDMQGNAFVLGGNLAIPAGESIFVISDGVFDGQESNFDLSGNAKLIIDTGISVTLRNMNLVGRGIPAIEMRSPTSRLTLQNVIINFDSDFTFSQGCLFILDDVIVAGTNKFSYASTSTSYIASHSMLCFDKNTTFSYSPRLTGRHAVSERNLIKMADKTSGMYFNQSILQLPDSGMQLTVGSVYFDNKVAVNCPPTEALGFEWGDGSVAGELDVNMLSGAYLENSGYVYYHPAP